MNVVREFRVLDNDRTYEIKFHNHGKRLKNYCNQIKMIINVRKIVLDVEIQFSKQSFSLLTQPNHLEVHSLILFFAECFQMKMREKRRKCWQIEK